MKPLEKLSQDESKWGPTRVEWFFKDNEKLQKLNKARRAQFLKSKGITVAVPRSNDIATFTTSSGMLAYRKRVVNRLTYSAVSTAPLSYVEVSLPFVSIQHEGRGR